MKAIELNSLEGLTGLAVVEVARPKPGPNGTPAEVEAAGMNYAELELMQGQVSAREAAAVRPGIRGRGSRGESQLAK